ncbi:MAG TPA: ISKra4 family transposase, partial [Chloroflexota bacterium]|nr:ISKra4 family transposase [Chloroflexota bacterium]
MPPVLPVGRAFFPLDEELALLPGALTPWLQERLVRLGTRMPFAAAASELAAGHQVQVSEATARRATERAGAAYVAVQTAQAAAIEREAPDPPAGPDRQLLSVDGAMVPLVGGQWAEVKTLAIGEIGAPVWDARTGEAVVPTTHLSYFSRLADAETFTRLALVETHRRGTATAGEVAAVADGAEWEQRCIDYHRTDAVRILDFPHGAQAVAAVAPVAGGADPAAQAEWLTEQCHELKHGAPQVVLDRLRAVDAALAPPAGEEPSPAAATVRTSLSYLEKRQEQIRYAEFRAAGYPIASGAVESANKLVVEARLKGAGMHWAPHHVNPMVALRTVA